jgi:hypothetical protein
LCARTARSPWEVQPRTTAIWLQCGPACVSRMQRPGKNSSRSWSIFSSTKATTALPSGGQDVANESMGDVAATTAAAPYACKALKRDVALPHSSRCCGGLRCLVTSRRRYERRMNYCPFIGLRGSAPHGPPIAPQVPGWSWLDPLVYTLGPCSLIKLQHPILSGIKTRFRFKTVQIGRKVSLLILAGFITDEAVYSYYRYPFFVCLCHFVDPAGGGGT